MEQVLYKLPDGWEWKRIEDVFTITSGKNLTKKDMQDKGEYPVYGGNGVTGRHTDFNLDGSNIVIGRVGALCGNVRLVEEKIWITDNAFFIKEYKIEILKEYLTKILSAMNIGETANKAAQPVISYKGIKDLNIPYPPLNEQKRIVEKLDSLLTRINTAIEHLEENIVLSKSLMASALFEKFHQEFNPMSIKDIFNVHNGRAYKQTELLDSGKYKVIRIQNLKGGENYYYSDLELDHHKYCEKGDLLFSWSGTPGTSFGAFIWNDEKAIFHYHIWKMEPLVEMNPRYAYWVLKDITEEAIASARGVAGMLHITKGTMENFVISMPSLEKQKQIANDLDHLSNTTDQLQIEINSKIKLLKDLKKSILDSAFKGEL